MRFLLISFLVLVFGLSSALGANTNASPLSFLSAPKRAFTERECLMCRFSVGLVKYALETQKGASQIYKLANTYCALAHIESPVVCSKVTKLFNREVVKVLTNAVVTPNQVCGLLSNNTCGHFYDPMAEWEVNLNVSASLDQEQLAKFFQLKDQVQDKSPYRVIHISDTHVDLRYKEGAEANCPEPLCCQAASTSSNQSRSEKSGFWGTYSNCDVPLRTLVSALKALNSTMNSTLGIDYIIWTGDIQPHDVWQQDKKSALATYESVFAKIFEYLPNAKIFPTLGNHEMVPVDSFSPSNLKYIARDDSPEWLYKKMDTYWSRWLPTDTAKTIEKDGFYSVVVRPGLKIVSLNTNFCHNSNLWLYINSTDPGNQLQWLIHELQISELQNEQVHIVGHIPPGSSDCLKVWSMNYNRILRRYSKTVAGQFFGHTHNSEFEIFYNQDGSAANGRKRRAHNNGGRKSHKLAWQPISVGFIGSSVTTFIGLNPSFRVYTIDPNQSFMPVDYETYYMNLTLANEQGPDIEPSWNSLGNFTELLGTTDTSPSSMHSLLLELVLELQMGESYLLEQDSSLDKRISPFDPANIPTLNVTESKLFKLARLFNSFSDSFTEKEFSKLNKKEFLCRFFTGQSNNLAACNKFIQDGLNLNEIAST